MFILQHVWGMGGQASANPLADSHSRKAKAAKVLELLQELAMFKDRSRDPQSSACQRVWQRSGAQNGALIGFLSAAAVDIAFALLVGVSSIRDSAAARPADQLKPYLPRQPPLD
jgi:hypothetical protein